jgi:hypothetical protein
MSKQQLIEQLTYLLNFIPQWSKYQEVIKQTIEILKGENDG